MLGRGVGFNWPWYLLARLPEEVEPGAVFPLQALDANFVRRHPRTLDAPMFGPHKSDDNPTLDVSTRPRVGLPTLFCEATVYPFQGSRLLHTYQRVDRGNKGR